MALVSDTLLRSAQLANPTIAIGGNGGALRQLLTSQQFPDGNVTWAGRKLPRKLLNRLLGGFPTCINSSSEFVFAGHHGNPLRGSAGNSPCDWSVCRLRYMAPMDYD